MRARARGRARGLLLAGAAVLTMSGIGTGCRSVDRYAHNLRELHEPDGSVRYQGDLMGAVEWSLRQTFEGIRFQILPPREESAGDPIPDPHGATLENLVGLGTIEPRDAREAGIQVELNGWLAVDDPYVLARERSVIELGAAARRLGVRGPRTVPEGARTASPEELEEVLVAISKEVPFVLQARGLEGADEGLREACRRLEELSLSLAGARRALAWLDALLGGLPPPVPADPALRALLAAHEELQADVVGLALAQALEDEEPLVRGRALAALYPLPEAPRGELLARALRDRELVVPALGLVASYGLPSAPDDLPEPDRRRFRALWLERLVLLTQELDGRISASACAALEHVSGSELRTLRREAWTAWWQAQHDGPAAGPADREPAR